MLERPLVKMGRDWGLEISDDILKKLEINPETDEVEIQIVKGVIYIKKHL